MKLQIHIAGAKCSGKTTLARNLRASLLERSFRPVIIDVDELKFKMFGAITALPGTPESLNYHGIALTTMFKVVGPAVLDAGGVPIFVAVHHKAGWDSAIALSETQGSTMKFIVLEAPSMEEATRRAAARSPDDHSDIRDFTNTVVRQSFLESVEKVHLSFKDMVDPRLFRLCQGEPGVMAKRALHFTLA